MKLKNNIPNLLTLINLLCGCIAIAMEFQGRYIVTITLIFIAAIFDFLDGFIARLLNAKSNIGKDLDSLSDIVSFGVLPGIILYRMISQSPNLINVNYDNINFIPFIAFLIPITSAIRLAKFNNDKKQNEYFIGLPTPANGLFIASLSAVLLQNGNKNIIYNFINHQLTDYKILIILSLLLSLLLISRISLISLKFKTFSWNKNKIKISFLIISFLLIILFQWAAGIFIMLIYFIMSLIFRPDKAINVND